MPSLSPSTNIGGSASSLIRSAASLTAQIQAYQDSLQAYQYQNSAYTDDAYAAYKDYLNNRISALQNTGTVADAQKALTLTKALEAATHSNISSSITRENIAIMGGNATKTDKLNLIGSQFQRALSNGDLTLAQSLESQYYGLSQQIQYEAQQAASAADTLAKAGNGTTTGTTGVTYQGEVISNLKNALQDFTQLSKNASEKTVNAAAKNFVQANKDVFQALGVNVATQQPNYWDVVNGVAGAIYNATVLKAQAEAPINPLVARTYALDAQGYLDGANKFDTLGGKLSMQELQQAMQDPSMFAYDNTSGKYIRTTTTGYQYITDQNGNKTLAPTYSGMAPKTQSGGDNVYFLTPNETTTMTKLGLNFSENKDGTTGNGVRVQATVNTPDWLRGVLGENGVANFYTDSNGNLVFKAASLDGKGDSTGNTYYTLASDANGLHGLFEHTLDGKISLAGGDYGFNNGAAQLLINQAQQTQYTINMQQQMQAAELKLAQPTSLPQISVQRPTAPAQNILQPAKAPQPIAPKIVSPQVPTVNPQQPASVNLQGGGFNLQGGGGGIRLQ